jgi:hypothetical protein
LAISYVISIFKYKKFSAEKIFDKLVEFYIQENSDNCDEIFFSSIFGQQASFKNFEILKNSKNNVRLIQILSFLLFFINVNKNLSDSKNYSFINFFNENISKIFDSGEYQKSFELVSSNFDSDNYKIEMKQILFNYCKESTITDKIVEDILNSSNVTEIKKNDDVEKILNGKMCIIRINNKVLAGFTQELINKSINELNDKDKIIGVLVDYSGKVLKDLQTESLKILQTQKHNLNISTSNYTYSKFFFFFKP